MQINEMFLKPIDRPIETVIKAADDDHLLMELEEYVVTLDIARNLQDLMAAYNDYSNANGVWISGHFGSGKSHLLKMLAHLLGDVQGSPVPRERFVEVFQENVGDQHLAAEIRRSSRVPAKSILFNVDDKADVSNKNRSDALMGVFQSVFDDARGYFAGDRAVARLESDLDQAGLFDQFKEAFEDIAGTPWLEGRESAIFMSADIDEAYARVRGREVSADILDRYEARDRLTISDFAKEVARWLDAQDNPNMRLNFFVDEIGQYIGSSTELMLNLQTIAENLNTYCRGRSFVFVTSQEALEGLIGHRTTRTGEDFSKIKDRFRTSLKLESQDVEEVVSRRLLTKTDAASNLLAGVWDDERSRLKHLFEFRDDSRSYNNYRNQAAFIDTYPFVNYQFSLFQDALIGLSVHDAFHGHHSSVGARNLLSVGQQAIGHLQPQTVGTLVSFDLMFEGVRSLLRSESFKSVRDGEKQFGADSPEARLLKVLFLVKYVDHFKATPRNLAVLLYGDVNVDVPALESEVQVALDRLVANTYIRQEGDRYAYLTNEEQDIEREIEKTNVDPGHETNALVKMLAGDVLSGQKYNYPTTGQNFPFEIRINDETKGRTAPLAVRFVTEEDPNNPTTLRVDYAGASEVLVVLDPNNRFFDDFLRWTRADQYLGRYNFRSATPSIQSIVNQKKADTHELGMVLRERLRELIASSLMLVQGREIKPRQSGEAARDRLNEGLERVVDSTYTSLPLLGGRTYSMQDIRSYLDPGNDFGFREGGAKDPISVAADDVAGYIRGVSLKGTQVTIARIVETYEGVPYGWDLLSIEAVIAYLLGQKEITLEVDGSKIPLTRAFEHLTKTTSHKTAVLKPVVDHDPRKIRDLQQFIQEYTNTPCTDTEAEILAERVKEGFDEELRFIREQQQKRDAYPFVADLDSVARRIQAARDHSEDWFLETFAGSDDAEQLLEDQEDLTGPLRGFMNSGQAKIFNDARYFVEVNGDNLKHLDEEQVQEVLQILQDPAPFRGAKDKFPKLKRTHASLLEALRTLLVEEKAEATQLVRDREKEVLDSSYYNDAALDAQAQVGPRIQRVLEQIHNARTIDAVRVEAAEFDSHGHTRLLDTLANSPKPSKQPEQPQPRGPEEPEVPEDHPKPVRPKKKVVGIQEVQKLVHWDRGPLKTEDDVNEYTDELWRQLHAALEEGKEVIVK